MFIKDLIAISPQNTFDLSFEQGDWQVLQPYMYLAKEPSYQDVIPAAQLRRMGKAVRMGIGAALPLLGRNEKPDGIVIGTANGGLEDCIKFLNQIVEYEEGVLTPTNFVQSTPNALAGQVALLSENQGYNVTHVNGALAFECAVLDAQLYFDEAKTPKSLLLGAVEEISNYNYNIDYLGGRFKEEKLTNDLLLTSETSGSYCGEGTTQFIVSNNSQQALAELVDVDQCSFLEREELEGFIAQFLAKNQISSEQVDCLLLGKNGDVFTDSWYQEAEAFFPSASRVYFKKAVGEYRTVSAFATYLGVRLITGSCLNLVEKENGTVISQPSTILIYNHFDGERHSLLLLRKPTTSSK